MRLITHYLSFLFRSRRHYSFVLAIVLLLSIVLVLSTINNHNIQSVDFISDEHKENPLAQTQNLVSSALTVTSKAVIPKRGLWPIDEKGRSLKTNFIVLDSTGFFGAAVSVDKIVKCSSSNTTYKWTRQEKQLDEVDFVISHDASGGVGILDRLQLNNEMQQYSMAFIMESEVHSSTGSTWAKYNFIMSYNLDDSYPEPATYFDVNTHITDLLNPTEIPFEKKETEADIVWIISNCNAHNGREGFVRRLMQEIKIHSYGSCLNNRHGYGARMVDNIHAYKKYKFVIAIENSNCVDYVTEKLVKAVESGSIPIVAGRDGRPDYRRYMPKHSYINIFDYKTIKDLADDLKRIANNKTLYESYLWYKKHDINISQLKTLSLNDKLKHLADVIGSNSTMIKDGIAGKEKSEDKICKLIRFIRQTSWQEIAAHKKTERVGPDKACLPSGNILNHFD